GLDADLKQRGVVYRVVYKWCFSLTYKLCKLLPLQTRKIIFASDSRSEMSGNFQFVYDELLKRNLNYDYHLLLKKGVDEKKNYREIFSLAYHLATAKFIILDDFYPMIYPLTIRKNAELIQLWHAVGAFKTFGFSRLGRPGGPSPKSKNHRNYTKAIVSSHNVAKHYAEGFGIDIENVIPTGIPRTDVFFDKDYQEEVRNNLYEEFPFLKGKKVITFAPTFRGNGQMSAHYPMEVLNLEKLYNELKDEYVFLFKIHPFVKNEFSIPYQFSDFFYDFSSYREINDLLFITDILITDYSSVCFEYALLNKPMIFFAYDVEEYVRTRDFYYDYHSFIPGPLAKTTERMIDIIQKEDFKMEKIEPFVKYFFDDLDGKATERVVDQLIINNFNELT
ncbi:MAG: CDP-glycerol glycerophosphotransferase family protein, partial [Niallia sp.]